MKNKAAQSLAHCPHCGKLIKPCCGHCGEQITPSITAQLMGRKGGQSTSEAKRQAQAVNCKLGGRKNYPKCTRPGHTTHQFVNDRCPCGYERNKS